MLWQILLNNILQFINFHSVLYFFNFGDDSEEIYADQFLTKDRKEERLTCMEWEEEVKNKVTHMKRDSVRLLFPLLDRAIGDLNSYKQVLFFCLLDIISVVFSTFYNDNECMLSICDFSYSTENWKKTGVFKARIWFSWIFPDAKMFILPVWAGSLSPDTRWGCICKGGGPELLDHYSLPSCAHVHCWT